MDVSTRESGPNPSANYLVGRVKRSLWGGSYIGAMAIDKTSGNPSDSYNQTEGVDTRLVFWRNLVVRGYAAQTRTPGISSGQSDLGASATYNNNWLELFGEHRKIGANFNPEVGFYERNNCLCDSAEVNLKPRPRLRGVRELNFLAFIFHADDTQHVLQTQEWQATFRIEFHNGSYSDDDLVDVFTQRLTQPFNIYKNVNIPVGLYHWDRHQFTYGTPLNRRLTMSFYERFGSYYNGRLNEARVRWSYRANERLSFDFSQQWNRFQLPIARRRLLGAVRRLPDQLLVLAFPDALDADSVEHGQQPGGDRQRAAAVELPARQRSLHHLHGRTALRQPGDKRPAVLPEQPHNQGHVFLAAIASSSRIATVTVQASASGAQNGASIHCVTARSFDEDINSDGLLYSEDTVFCQIVPGVYTPVLAKHSKRGTQIECFVLACRKSFSSIHATRRQAAQPIAERSPCLGATFGIPGTPKALHAATQPHGQRQHERGGVRTSCPSCARCAGRP